MWFRWPTSERAAQRLSNLVFLSIRTTEVESQVKMPLDFPRLKSLEFFVEHGNGVKVWDWELPLLTTLVLILETCDIEGMLKEIHKIAPNLKFLSLYGGTFNAEEPSQIWSFFPHLIALSCPMDFFLIHLPPAAHPLQYFMGVNMGTRILKKVRACAKGWENCRILMGRFFWIEDFERVHRERQLVLDDETRNPFRCSSERLRAGLEFKDTGVRYEDRYGLSFEEACDRFGGATPIASVKSFIDAVQIA
jgi:hypothetical protein